MTPRGTKSPSIASACDVAGVSAGGSARGERGAARREPTTECGRTFRVCACALAVTARSPFDRIVRHQSHPHGRRRAVTGTSAGRSQRSLRPNVTLAGRCQPPCTIASTRPPAPSWRASTCMPTRRPTMGRSHQRRPRNVHAVCLTGPAPTSGPKEFFLPTEF